MHRHKHAERTAYYRQEASACATAALTTAITEIKQAYLDLEQGWLCLAPRVEETPAGSVDSMSTHEAESQLGTASNDSSNRPRQSICRPDPAALSPTSISP